MKRKNKRSIKYIPLLLAAVIVTVAVLLLLQRLVTPKYATSLVEGAMTAEYYDNAGGNDVIFFGDCEAYETYSPVTLWEKFGITSYVRGNSQQMIWQSYYMLEDTIKYEIPKVVVLSVCDLMHASPDDTKDDGNREAYNRMALDGMRWSASKFMAINVSMTANERDRSGLKSYIFPILRYHDRILSLTQEDIDYMFKKADPVTDNGYLMQVGAVSGADQNYNEMPLISYQFSDLNYEYLNKFVKLCNDNDITLVLVKSPSLSPIWHPQYEEQVEQFAKENNLLYINTLEHQDEYALDWATDTYDKGLHLNVDGVEKVTEYVGNILKSEYNLVDHRQDASLASHWQEITDRYYQRKADMLKAWEEKHK